MDLKELKASLVHLVSLETLDLVDQAKKESLGM